MKLSISKKFLLIVSGIIMIFTILSYLIFHTVIKDRYIKNFKNEMGNAELVLSNYLDNRFLLLNSGIEILLSDPRFLAATAEGDPQTAQEEISDFRHLVNADFLIIADTTDMILAQEAKNDDLDLDDLDLHRIKLGHELHQKYRQISGSIYQLISTSIYYFSGYPVGKLIAGFNIDKTVIEKINQLTGCEIAIVNRNNILLSTPSSFNLNQGEFARFFAGIDNRTHGQIYTIHQDGEDFLVLPHFLNDKNTVITLTRSLSDQLSPAMETIIRYLFSLLIGTFVLSVVTISVFISKNLTSVVDRLVSAARNISRGDLKDSIVPVNNDELGYLAECFDDMRLELIKSREELEKAQENRINAERMATIGKLTSGIMHDLKGQMTVISLAVETMNSELVGKEKQKLYASKIKNQLHQMVTSTQEILEFSRGEKSIIINELEFTDYVKNQIEVHREKFNKSKILLDYNLPPPFQVWIDENKFKRVIDNLLNNAFEALFKGQKVSVNVTCKTDIFEMQIKDNGIGIAIDILPDIFKPFVTRGKKAGTGLGLAITKKIIEDHRGNIVVESNLNRGSCFTITLPRWKKSKINKKY